MTIEELDSKKNLRISENEKFFPHGKDTLTYRNLKMYRDMLYPGVRYDELHHLLKDGVVDIGSGAGLFVADLKRTFPDISHKFFSIDVQDFTRIQHSRKKAIESGVIYDYELSQLERDKIIDDKKGYIKSLAQRLPFKDNSLGEAVMNFGPLHYISEETHRSEGELGDLRALRSALLLIYEMLRVVKPGGRVRITPFSSEKIIATSHLYIPDFPKDFHKYFEKILQECKIEMLPQKWIGPIAKVMGGTMWSIMLIKPTEDVSDTNNPGNLDYFRKVLNDLDYKIQKTLNEQKT